MDWGERGILKLNFNQFRFVAQSSVSVPSGCQPFLFSTFFCFAIWARLAKKINLSKLQHTHLHREKEIRVHSTATAADALQTERQNNHMSNLSSATKQYTSAEVAQGRSGRAAGCGGGDGDGRFGALGSVDLWPASVAVAAA